MVQEIVEKQVDDNSDNLTEQEKEQIKEVGSVEFLSDE